MNYTEEFAIVLDKSGVNYDVDLADASETFSIYEVNKINYTPYKITVTISKGTITFAFRQLAIVDLKKAKQLLEAMRTLNDLNMRATPFKWSLSRKGVIFVTYSTIKEFQSPEVLYSYLEKMIKELFGVYVPAMKERIYRG